MMDDSKKEKYIPKEKKYLKKENLPIFLAIMILICLIIALVYMIFFTKSKEVTVPELPNYDSYDVGVVDFSEKGANANDLNSKKSSTLNINNTIVSDYYKEGILLSNTQVDYLNDNFIVSSGPLSSTEAFISAIDKNGKLKWLTKLDNKEYGNIKISKINYYNNHYYVVGVSEKNFKKSLTIIQIDLNGKKVNTNEIKDNINGKIEDFKISNNIISVVTSTASDVIVYFIDTKSNEFQKEVVLSKTVTIEGYINYETSQINDTSFNIVFKNNTKYQVASINTSNYQTQVNNLEDINNLNFESGLIVNGYLDGFIGYSSQKIYKLNNTNKLINKFDYASVKLEDDAALKEKYKDDESIDVSELVNTITISNINISKEQIVVSSNTSYSKIYDIYDSSLKLNKRFIIDAINYQYEDGVLLNDFYIDGVIYEVYSYGFETPSILISQIG